MKKFYPNNAKLYNSANITSTINENSRDLTKALHKFLGGGVYTNSGGFESSVYTETGGVIQTFGLTGNNEVLYLEEDKFGLVKNELQNFSIIFDENTPLNGSIANPIEIPVYFKYVPPSNNEHSSLHTLYDLLAVFVNGTPLKVSDEYSLIYASGDKRSIYFNYLRQGLVYPNPVDKNGRFLKELISPGGISISDLSNISNSGTVNLRFKFLKGKTISKELVLFVNKSNNYSYYHVPYGFPKYPNGLFYIENPDVPYGIKIVLGNVLDGVSSSDKIGFFFATRAIRKSAGITTNEYITGIKNLKEDLLNDLPLILAINESDGSILDISFINRNISPGAISFNPLSGNFFLNPTWLPNPNSIVLFGDIPYEPPLHISAEVDYVNNITIWGYPGLTIRRTSSSPYSVYIRNVEVVEEANSIFDVNSKVSSLKASSKIIPMFFPSGDSSELFASVSPSSYTINPNILKNVKNYVSIPLLTDELTLQRSSNIVNLKTVYYLNSLISSVGDPNSDKQIVIHYSDNASDTTSSSDPNGYYIGILWLFLVDPSTSNVIYSTAVDNTGKNPSTGIRTSIVTIPSSVNLSRDFDVRLGIFGSRTSATWSDPNHGTSAVFKISQVELLIPLR